MRSVDKAPLQPIAAARVVIHKKAQRLELFDGARLVKSYFAISGSEEGPKRREGDRRTPIGRFRICRKNPRSKYHLSLAIDYPNVDDAARGIGEGLITQQQYEAIVNAIREHQAPDWRTALGGEIFIHGHGDGRQGTAGCVAVANADIEELYAVCGVGTPVEILE